MTPGRRVLAVVAAAAVVVAAGAAAIGLSGRTEAGRAGPQAGAVPSTGAPSVSSPVPDTTAPTSTAPTRPPSRVCSTPPKGPTTAPSGAVVVRVGEHLGDSVEAGTPGTTYWLEPGVHRLGGGEFDQVLPQQGDRFLGAPGAVLDGTRVSRYAFGGQATGVTIEFLTVQNFGGPGTNGDEGVVNHDSAAGWTLRSNLLQRNAGAALMIGSGGRVLGNCLRDNGQYGFNAYDDTGVRDVVLQGNEITGNNTDDWERRKEGCGCTGGGKFWATVGARVLGNYVHDNRGPGLWADTNNAGFLVQGNWVSDNDAEGMLYETSYNAAFVGNMFARNGLVQGPKNPGFPTPALYLSESGSDPRVPGPYGQHLVVADNVFEDNWSGVVGWENADRFAGSPANTSTGVTTLVDPGVVTEKACSTPRTVRTLPYLDDCRWKTQNVVVERNVFSLDPAKVPRCRASRGCGFNGVFSNYGTYPDWSPYKGTVVQRQITFEQGNVFRDNTYRGPWRFVVEEFGNDVPWQTWRGAPYGQDAGSTQTSAG